MFKKFSPKEDVANSTSLKSSVQRNIRSAWVEQTPFLSMPAWTDTVKPDAAAPTVETEAAAPTEPKDGDDGEAEDDETATVGGKKSGGGKKKGGKGGGKKGGKGGKGKKGGDPEDDDDKTNQGEGADAQQQPLTVLDEIWPKKEPLGVTKCHERLNIYTLDSRPLIFQSYDGPFIPVLKLVHRYPNMLPRVQVDAGAIKFLLKGADMMAPGLLSAGGNLPEGLAKGTVVAIHAQGKEHAAGVGIMAASSEEIKKSGKGTAVEVMTYVGDDLWIIEAF